jgi:hypothetical protein
VVLSPEGVKVWQEAMNPESPIGKPIDAPAKDMETRFYQLVKQWKKATEHLSSSTRMAKHPAYREIIAMGKPALPLLLAELKRDPDFWFAALR